MIDDVKTDRPNTFVFNQRNSALKKTDRKPSRAVLFPLPRMIQSNL